MVEVVGVLCRRLGGLAGVAGLVRGYLTVKYKRSVGFKVFHFQSTLLVVKVDMVIYST